MPDPTKEAISKQISFKQYASEDGGTSPIAGATKIEVDSALAALL